MKNAAGELIFLYVIRVIVEAAMHSSERIPNNLVAPWPEPEYVDYLDYECPECGYTSEAERDLEYHACPLCGEHVYHGVES